MKMKADEQRRAKEKMFSLELAGVPMRKIIESVGISERTYWNWKGERQNEVTAQYLQNKYRLVSEWWERQKAIYGLLMADYTRSRQDPVNADGTPKRDKEGNIIKARPNYALLFRAQELENDVYDRLRESGFVPNVTQEAKMNTTTVDFEKEMLEAWKELNERQTIATAKARKRPLVE